MRIESLHIDRFGGLRGFDLHFEPGLTVVYGGNESGKTTVMAFVRAMLYGLNGKSASVEQNERKKYMPWGETSMGGSLRLVDGRNAWEIIRVFGQTKKNDTCCVTEAGTGEILTVPAGEEPGQMLLGVDEAVFCDTLFLSAKGSRLAGDGAALGEKIRNLIGTGAENVDLNKLFDRLQAAKSEIAPRMRDRGRLFQVRSELDRARQALIDGAQIEAEAERLTRQVKELSGGKSSVENLRRRVDEQEKAIAQLYALHAQRDEVRTRIRALEEQLDEEEARENVQRSRRGGTGWFLLAAVLAVCSAVLGFMVNPHAYLGIIAAAAALILGVCRCKGEMTGPEDRHAQIDGILEELSQKRKKQTELDARCAEMDAEIQRMSGEIDQKLQNSEPDRENALVQAQVALDRVLKEKQELERVRIRAMELEKKEEDLEQVVLALDIAQEELKNAAHERQEGIAPEIVSVMQELLPDMTAGRYTQAAVSRNMEVSLHPETGDALRSWAYFSSGTVEQVYLALRLSLVRILCRSCGKMPLLLDDPFALFDDDRAQEALALLDRFAADDQQVILLTCRMRDAQGACTLFLKGI